MSLLLWMALAGTSAANGQTALGALFPKSNEITGWTLKEGPKFFTGSQLFDYMDGAAEIPKSYAFRQLGTAKYQQGVRTLEVAVFDMSRPADAYGYYSARSFLEHTPHAKERILALDHPAHLYASVGVLTFWKDHFTLILQPDIGTTDETTLLRFARTISAKIQPKGAFPDLLGRLPHAQQVANSARYVRGKPAFDALVLFVPQDVFGMARGGAEAAAAEYRLGGPLATLCVIRYPSSRSASDAYSAFRQLLTTHKAVFAASRVPGSFVARAKKEKGTGAVLSGSSLGIVFDARDAKAAETALRQLASAMRAK